VVAEPAFTPQAKIWLFYALKDAGYCCFYLPFPWRSNSCKKVYVLYDKDMLLVIFLAGFFINLWLGGYICYTFL